MSRRFRLSWHDIAQMLDIAYFTVLFLHLIRYVLFGETMLVLNFEL